MMAEWKKAWQRKNRREFAAAHGYSTAADYATGGLREAVLERDGHACATCRLSAQEHLRRWGRPITVDHIDRDRTRNVMENLQVLCLPCHGRKDVTPAFLKWTTEPLKEQILSMRARRVTYQTIADALGISIGGVWKASRRWEMSHE